MSVIRALLACLCLSIPTMVRAQSVAPDAAESALGVRQQRVGRMMSELERRFLALAKSLEEKEPERAARLVKAFEESRSLLVEQRMVRIAGLLNDTKLDNASNEQQQVLDDVRKLISILLTENGDKEKDREEIELLKKWHKELNELRRDEQQQQAATEKLHKKDESIDQLQKQMEAVRELIRRQQDLINQTNVAKTANIAGLPALADRQQTLRSDTQFVAKSMTPPNAEGRPNQPQPSEPQAGQKPLEQAAANQQTAEQQLQAGEAKTAQQSEEQALQQLKKSLVELEQELQRQQQPPENQLQKMAQSQDQTEKKANALGNQMSKASASKSTSPSAASASACSSACSQCMSKASQHMQNASQSLKKNSPSAASKEQKQADEELKKAQEEIEKRLNELGEKLDNETIVRLEDIFNEMLTRQRQTSAHTVQFDADHQGEKNSELKRADRLTLRRLTQEERDLAELAQQALVLIEKDGTSISFPVVVANMQDNLQHIATRIEEAETGAYTQTLQLEVQKTLEELIDALQVAKKNGSGGGQCKPGNCKPALLPNTAELKLLRSLQLRVNRRTKAFDEARPNGHLDEARRKEVVAISQVQKDLAGMVRNIIARTKAAQVQQPM